MALDRRNALVCSPLAEFQPRGSRRGRLTNERNTSTREPQRIQPAIRICRRFVTGCLMPAQAVGLRKNNLCVSAPLRQRDQPCRVVEKQVLFGRPHLQNAIVRPTNPTRAIRRRRAAEAQRNSIFSWAEDRRMCRVANRPFEIRRNVAAFRRDSKLRVLRHGYSRTRPHLVSRHSGRH